MIISLIQIHSVCYLFSISLWRRANARNVRLYYPYWQYTDLNIICAWSGILFPYLRIITLTVTGRAFYFFPKWEWFQTTTIYELLSRSREVVLFTYFRSSLLLQCYISFARKKNISKFGYDTESNKSIKHLCPRDISRLMLICLN